MDVVSDRKITKLVATQGMTRVYEREDGTWLTASSGTVAWRNNNPGNLKFEFQGSADTTVRAKRSKEDALAMARNLYEGVVDLDQWGNAVFENYEAGRIAQKDLLLRDSMRDRTVEELVKRYSTADYSGITHHANQVAIIHATASAQGLDLHGRKVLDMSSEEVDALADGLAKAEGWKVGTTQVSPPLTEEQLSEALDSRPQATQGQTGNRADPVQRMGERGPAVGQLQQDLSTLGYTNSDGTPIVADERFGQRTKEAVESFQREHGLPVDGVVGSNTRKVLDEQLKTQAQQPRQPQFQWRLDDPAHPDHSLFEQAREHVYRLDQQVGRVPDQRSDNLAAALAVSARADGLQRIDQVALDDGASKLWAAQRPPGARDHFWDKLTNVEVAKAVATPIEQSSAQWPQAVRQQAEAQEQARAQTEAQVVQPAVQAPQVIR
jgi:peptidoglycan hydrolase-like protein with peptidoglycan-binding domain